LLWFGATQLIASTLGTVIASRLYQVIGDRLNTPFRQRSGWRDAPRTPGLDLAGSRLANILVLVTVASGVPSIP